MTEHAVAWWNLENLFETSTFAGRSERLRRTLRGELSGWTQAVLRRKISQLARIISQMNAGRGPDLLGVCEVENRSVLLRLRDALVPLGRGYEVTHHDTADGRGIDVAFLYDRDIFTAEETFHYVVRKRNATRDLFQTNFRTAQGRLLCAIGNHWPARSGGRLESEPYRMMAAETLSYWIARVQEVHGRNANVLVMGDFNDEPFDRSLREYALSTQSRTKVTYARNPMLFNLMFPEWGRGVASHYFNNFPNMLDQFLVSRGLARLSADFRADPDSVAVFRPAEMVNDGRYPTPLRFGRPSKPSSFDRDGYSDHFPITLTLVERD